MEKKRKTNSIKRVRKRHGETGDKGGREIERYRETEREGSADDNLLTNICKRIYIISLNGEKIRERNFPAKPDFCCNDVSSWKLRIENI